MKLNTRFKKSILGLVGCALLAICLCGYTWVPLKPNKSRPLTENLDYQKGNNSFLQALAAKILATKTDQTWANGWDNTSVDNVTIIGPVPNWHTQGELAAIPKKAGGLSYDAANSLLYSCNGTAWHDVSTGSPAQPTPAGAIMQYSGATAPDGWFICNGVEVSRTTYSTLYAVIGTTYGVGDGSTTFNLPNCQGRVPVGAGGVYDANGLFNSFTLAASAGELTHTLTSAEMPSHTHTISSGGAHTHTINLISTILTEVGSVTGYLFSATPLNGLIPSGGAHTHAPANTGGGTAHNNLQPYIALNYIIKY